MIKHTTYKSSCVFALFIAALVSSKANGINMRPVWDINKTAALAVGAVEANIEDFAHVGTSSIMGAILDAFAIAPWAYVGFDACSNPRFE